MKSPTFTAVKIAEELVGTGVQAYRGSVTAAGTYSLDDVASLAAESLGDNETYVKAVAATIKEIILDKIVGGNRVIVDGLGHFEFYAEGTFDTADEAWDSDKHSVVIRLNLYQDLKKAIEAIVPTNTLSKVTIQLLGAQDAVTYAQNELTIGNTLLLQGKNIQVTAANTDEGYFLVNDEHTFKATVASCTAGTADVTFPDAVAGTYTLEVRGRAGLGLDRSLVSASIKNFTVKAAE